MQLDKQANDAGHFHIDAKQFGKKLYELNGSTDDVNISTTMQLLLDKFLKTVRTSSYETFRIFVIHSPACVAANYTNQKCRAGYLLA